MFTNSCAAVHAQIGNCPPFCDDSCCLQYLQDGPYEKLYIAHETDVSENGPSVTISVRGRHHSMTVQEISIMPVSEFAFLWTVHSISPPIATLHTWLYSDFSLPACRHARCFSAS